MVNKERAYEEFLVASARLNDAEAMAALVQLRGPRLLVHATRLLGNRDEAQDAVQDAWIEIFRALRQLRSDAAFAAWATRIVTRRCARIIAGNQRTRAIARELAPLTETAATENSDDVQLVQEAIASLPPQQAATVALFYLEDMSLAEVAVALDVPVGTVKSRLSLARERLKAHLKGAFDDQ
ncbi:RNA polymerase sigma factor [Cognatishimia maritima]|uniref:RNA polymerase sigma-70 factor, ECF subfamily n=1 Tax=Cognatishimia maritima TaxID=870908 RepID=A0A1M5VC73_9RHOB|nr:RNA polymerase sigma factor [Cognatishimia maritima]SHH72872.1 RNA polymerase sigma-70 factor, ECF subfamily [Cognatishimia maritima]